MKNQNIRHHIAAGLFALIVTASVPALAAGGPPNPFESLKTATGTASSFEKADPRGYLSLRVSDIDATTSRLDALLKLTPYEKTVIRSILATRNEQLDRIDADQALSPEERDLRTEAVYRVTETRIADMLTPDQKLTYKVELGRVSTDDPDQVRQQTERNRMAKLFTLDARFAGAKTTREAVALWGDPLKMTEAQRQSLIPVMESEARQLDALVADKSLSPDTSRVRSQAVMIDTERRIYDMLTSEQKRQLDLTIQIIDAPSVENPRAH